MDEMRVGVMYCQGLVQVRTLAVLNILEPFQGFVGCPE